MERTHTNPILHTRMYQVEFTGGEVTELSANVIAESMYAQCNADGNECLLFDVLVDSCKDNKVISLADQQTSIQGRPQTCETTAGWQICCQWKNGSPLWQKMFESKDSHLVHTAEFAVAQGIDHKPAFYWWVKHMLKKRRKNCHCQKMVD